MTIGRTDEEAPMLDRDELFVRERRAELLTATAAVRRPTRRRLTRLTLEFEFARPPFLRRLTVDRRAGS
jgi:hypothetical protein